ncbi:MAG: alanine racemase [bacterium]
MTSRLSISLGNLAANYQLLCKHNQGPVAAVVKADGYGLGAVAIARRLLAEQCQHFFVATPQEGVALRSGLSESGAPPAKIYVLAGVYPEVLPLFTRFDLVPVLNTAEQIQTWISVQRPAALHFDSGMHRLGLPLQAQDYKDLPFPVELFVSHFANADERGHPTIKDQLQRSLACYNNLRRQYPDMQFSLSNSAGLLNDMGVPQLARAGIALYGGNPFLHEENPTLPVATLQARVLQVRRLPAGCSIGYGATCLTTRETDVATLGAGYADGVPRLLSGKGRVWFDAGSAAMLGRVSMDLITVDVTGLPVASGDWAEIVGPNISIDEVAAQAQTISYEILTGLGRRSERVYVEGC